MIRLHEQAENPFAKSNRQQRDEIIRLGLQRDRHTRLRQAMVSGDYFLDKLELMGLSEEEELEESFGQRIRKYCLDPTHISLEELDHDLPERVPRIYFIRESAMNEIYNAQERARDQLLEADTFKEMQRVDTEIDGMRSLPSMHMHYDAPEDYRRTA